MRGPSSPSVTGKGQIPLPHRGSLSDPHLAGWCAPAVGMGSASPRPRLNGSARPDPPAQPHPETDLTWAPRGPSRWPVKPTTPPPVCSATHGARASLVGPRHVPWELPRLQGECRSALHPAAEPQPPGPETLAGCGLGAPVQAGPSREPSTTCPSSYAP